VKKQYSCEGVIRVHWWESGELVDADRNGLGYGLLFLDELEEFIRNGGIVVNEWDETTQWTVEDVQRIKWGYASEDERLVLVLGVLRVNPAITDEELRRVFGLRLLADARYWRMKAHYATYGVYPH